MRHDTYWIRVRLNSSSLGVLQKTKPYEFHKEPLSLQLGGFCIFRRSFRTVPIKATLTDSITHPTQPRTVVTIDSDSNGGSFTLPLGIRLFLRRCKNITCTSNEGNNEL